MANFIPKIVYNSTTITFDVPLEGDPFGEVVKANNVTSRAASGARQNSQLYLEEFLELNFTFVSKTLKDQVSTFFTTWASQKKVFTFYPHSDVSTDSHDYILEDDKFEPNRILPGASSDFLYEFKLHISRVL